VGRDLGLLKLGQVSLASNNTAVNSALTKGNSEETVFTPSSIPGVSNDPIVGAVFVTPTSDLDGVATENRSTCVSIDTTSVGNEIGVDGETGFDGAVLENVGLDGSRVG